MILVTGGTGHVGNVLIRRLLERGEQVRTLVLPGDPCVAFEGLDVECVAGDVLDPTSLRRALEGVDVVYHLAGIVSIMPDKGDLMRQVNVEGVRNVAQLALEAGVDRMVHVSSIHAFKRMPQGVLVDEKTPLALESPPKSYDRTKAEGTLAVLQTVRQGLDAVVLCPTGIIGPYDYLGSEMGQTIVDFARRRWHLLVEGAYDFVDVRDVVDGLLAAQTWGRSGELYILSGALVALTRLREIVQELAGIHTPRTVVPFGLAKSVVRLAEVFYRWAGLTPRFTQYSLRTVQDNAYFSHTKATRELNYRPRSLRQTVADVLAWRKGVSVPV
jgi:dihydroflavonol-4-reductase